MITLLRPILFTFLQSSQVKKLVIDMLEAYSKSTTNTIDDKIVNMVKKAL